MSSEIIRWGIIGCGNVTEVKSGPGFQKADHSQLVAVMRRDAALAEDYANRHGVPKWYSDAEQLIADPEVDAVYIATPPAYHKPYTLAAARAGKPVYVEKPMALNYAECEEMIYACEQAGVPLYVAYYRRALPHFLQIKQWLDTGAIGDIRYVNTIHYRGPSEKDKDADHLPWRVQPELAGGGYFVDVGSHTLDILDFLLGPIREVNGFASNQGGLYPAEDIVSGTYRFESGVHGTGTWCFSALGQAEYNEIVGSEGKIVFSTFQETPVKLITRHGEQQFPVKHPAHIQQPLIQSIVNDLLGRGDCESTGHSGARTNWVMDKLLGNTID